MGLNTRGGGSSNKTYLSIYQGEMVLEYDTRDALEKKLDSLGLDPDGIEVRQRLKGKNEGKDVFYYVLQDVSGMLTNISITENDFGEFVELEFTDVDEKFAVSLGDISSRMAKDFTRRMGNLDVSQEVVFGVWRMTEDETKNGKSYSGVKMYQGEDNAKIEYALSYDDMPQPEEKTKGRKKVWDYTEQENFLYDSLMEFIDENFKPSTDEPKAEVKSAPKAKEEPKPVRNKRATAPATDDLPF